MTEYFNEEKFVELLQCLDEIPGDIREIFPWEKCIPLWNDFSSIMPESIRNEYLAGKLITELEVKMSVVVWKAVIASGLTTPEESRYLGDLLDYHCRTLNWQPEGELKKLDDRQIVIWKKNNIESDIEDAAQKINRGFSNRKPCAGFITQDEIDDLLNGGHLWSDRRLKVWPYIPYASPIRDKRRNR